MSYIHSLMAYLKANKWIDISPQSTPSSIMLSFVYHSGSLRPELNYKTPANLPQTNLFIHFLNNSQKKMKSRF